MFFSECRFYSELWGPPMGFGEQGNKAIYFRGTREQKSKTEWNRGTKAILGNREHRKSRIWFWGIRGNADFFREQGNRCPPPPPPPPPPTTTTTLWGPQLWNGLERLTDGGSWTNRSNYWPLTINFRTATMTRYGPQRQKTYLWTHALSGDSDQPAHSRSLIRIFTAQLLDSQWCEISSYGQRRRNSGQTVRTCRLI